MKPGRRVLLIASTVLIVSVILLPLKRIFFRHERTPLINSAHAKKKAVIYFANEEGKLVGRNTEIESGATVLDDIKAVITAECAAPGVSGLLNAVPAGAAVRNIFIDDKRCVYLDFERSFVERHAGGTAGESLTLDALKKTIAANYPELDSLVILVEGKELASIAGHISTRGKMKVR